MSKQVDIPQWIDDFTYARDHRLLDDEVGKVVTRLVKFGVVDDLVLDLIQDPVRRHKISQAFRGIPFEIPVLNRGNLLLGYTHER